MADSAWQRIMASLHSAVRISPSNRWPREVCVREIIGCKPPTVVEAFGIGFDYKREEALA